MSDETGALPFTGERFTPECMREIWHEHWHRYVFARCLAAGRRVLDAACGEGYGSALLASVATDVIGVDIDDTAIAHARARYGIQANLRFERADVTELPFGAGRFDVVVSFETLEHLAAQERLLQEFSRVLTDDGTLLISSPDKRTYSDLAGFRNEFHVRELYREELLDLLAPHFGEVRLYGQKLLFQSAVWSLDAPAPDKCEVSTASLDGTDIAPGITVAPMYYIAACAKRRLPAALPELSLFGDREESVYAHYNQEVRKNISAGGRIAELEAEVERLRAQGPAATPARPDWRWWRNRQP